MPSSSMASLNQSQQEAISAALGSDLSYLWGPPGTGKTRTVSALVQVLAEGGRRVIVATPTNVATDNVALSCVNRASASLRRLQRNGYLVRFGETSKAIRKASLDLDSAFETTAVDEFPSVAVAIKALWQKSFKKIWENSKGSLKQDGSEWFGSAKFDKWEDMWEWWLSDEPLPGDDECALLDLMGG